MDLISECSDLNDCVDDILSRKKPSYEGKTVIRFCSKKASKEKRKRTRKDRQQQQVLMAFYRKKKNWEKSDITKLSKQSGLKESQIYKWNWDMRKKAL